MRPKNSTKWTRELLERLVADAVSVYDVLRKAGLKPSAGMCTYVGAKIRGFGLDTAHFTGRSTNSSNNGKKSKVEWREILTNNRLGHKEESTRLRRAMLEAGFVYACAFCGNTGEWRGEKLVLEIDHINGNNLDNRKQNLRFLCPNCHAQTPTHGGKNRKTHA